MTARTKNNGIHLYLTDAARRNLDTIRAHGGGGASDIAKCAIRLYAQVCQQRAAGFTEISARRPGDPSEIHILSPE